MENIAQWAMSVRSWSFADFLWCMYSLFKKYVLFFPFSNLGGREERARSVFFSAFDISHGICRCSYNDKNILIFSFECVEKVCHKQGYCSILFYIHLYWYWKWATRETTGAKAVKNWKTNKMLHFQPETGYNVSWEKAFNRRKFCGKLMVTLGRID